MLFTTGIQSDTGKIKNGCSFVDAGDLRVRLPFAGQPMAAVPT